MGHPASTDITLIFKSCVKTIRTRNKACGILHPDRPKPERRSNPLAIRAREVTIEVTRIAKFIEEVSAAYLNFAGYLPGAPQITDTERDRIDAGIPRLAEDARKLLGELEIAVAERNLSDQHKEHQLAVVKLIKNFLRLVIGRHADLRAQRIAHSNETKRLARLDGRVRTERPQEDRPVIPTWTPQDDESNLNELSAEELQMFEQENNALQMELSGLMSELHTLEGTLTGVAKLQEQFTEKVVEQEMEIDAVFSTVVGTTETLKDANEELRKAIQRNAGLRVYILFSLLVMSFSLLFLDWYND